jgi:hypothetical protein
VAKEKIDLEEAIKKLRAGIARAEPRRGANGC